jgi:lipooligosaccharide transport system ATP-binding protein
MNNCKLMTTTAITVENISKSFGDLIAVNSLSFEVTSGTCFGLLGPNGAGKTTMMKMLYAKTLRDKNCTGKMKVFGFEPDTNQLDIKNISGVVQQSDNLDEELNVIQNLQIYAKFYNIPSKQANERIDYLLDFLELSEKHKAVTRELSGGMKRRLVIARALLNNPKLLILDEPTTGLDPQVRHLIWDKLRHLKREGTTILLTTHYMEEAFQLCDELIIMHKGQSIIQGKPLELLAENIEKFVLELTNDDSMAQIEMGIDLNNARIDKGKNIVRLYSDDMDTLRNITNKLESSHYHLRQSNLEDVFLKATGRTLNEQQ